MAYRTLSEPTCKTDWQYLRSMRGRVVVPDAQGHSSSKPVTICRDVLGTLAKEIDEAVMSKVTATISEECAQVESRRLLFGAMEITSAKSIRAQYEKAKAVLVKNGACMIVNNRRLRTIDPTEVMKLLRPCKEALHLQNAVLSMTDFAIIRRTLKYISTYSIKREVGLSWKTMRSLRRIAAKLAKTRTVETENGFIQR